MDSRFRLLKRGWLIVLLLGLAACVAKHETDYTLTPSVFHGAALGGVAGVAIAVASSGSAPLAIIGGVGGGGLLGFLVETKTALMYRLAEAGVQVIELGDTVTLVLPSDHFYDIHSPRLKPASYGMLRDIARLMRVMKQASITITAYTDNVGAPRFKKDLSKAQAEQLASFFWAHGIDYRRIHAIGHGKNHPIASNRTAFGSGMNRRVEIRLRKETDFA